MPGRVAVVTGGGRGIGRATALLLAKEGWQVAISARSQDQLAETVKLAESPILAIAGDVADPAAVTGLARAVEEKLGPIDLLVNNAGTAGPLGAFWETDPQEWWRCQEVNLRGPMMFCRTVLPGMIARRAGRIVNIASGAGCHPLENMSAYVTSKTSLIRFTEQLAMELEGLGVTLFSVRPGVIRTAMAEEARHHVRRIQQLLDQGAEVTPEAVAALVLQLASGVADRLSGRMFAVQDDLNAILNHADDVRARELYLLRMLQL